MSRSAFVHIGLPKSGSTAFQSSLLAHRDQLSDRGWRPLLYDGAVPQGAPSTRALNLAAAVIRPHLDAWFRIVVPESVLPHFVSQSWESVRRQASLDDTSLVASMEDLCLIRTREEVEALARLMEPRHLHVVLVLRDLPGYRRSLKHQLARAQLPTWSIDPDSCFYTAEGSWLFDHHSLVEVIESVLGSGSVTTIDYGEAVARDGSIVPALWRACDLPLDLLDSGIWDRQWVNAAPDTGSVDIESEESVEILRDYAWRLKVENDLLRASAIWRVTASLRRIKRSALTRFRNS